MTRWSPSLRLAFVTVGDTARKVGGHRYNSRVISGLRARGVKVEEIVASAEEVGEQRLASRALGERLAPQEFDAILVDALARVVCAPHLDRWRAATPVVAMVHELPSVAGSGETELPYEEPLLRADRLICVSRHGASLLEERGVPSDRIQVVPPGLDPAPAPRRDEVEDASQRVLCVAQWLPRKNIAGLVRAWRASRGSAPGAVLELVGDTGAHPAYAARVRQAISGAGDVVVRGGIGEEELHRAYAAADIFVLPSTYEGYGMVYAEAMSHGLPVLALATGPVSELVGEAGLLVEPGDEDGLARALRELLADAKLREQLSGAALRRAAELPDWDNAAHGFLTVVEAVTCATAERARR